MIVTMSLLWQSKERKFRSCDNLTEFFGTREEKMDLTSSQTLGFRELRHRKKDKKQRKTRNDLSHCREKTLLLQEEKRKQKKEKK